MKIFLDARDCQMFLVLLGEVVESCEIECWAYSLMPNHYHIAVRPTLPNLSEAFQYLNGEYAKWWNARHSRVGHAFQGRFKDQVVEHEAYLHALCRYIARNPVRAGLTERPEQWEWSSYAATVGLCTAPPFLDTSSVLGLFGDGPIAVLQERFARFVQGADTAAIDDRIRSREWVLGEAPFKKVIRAELKAQRASAKEETANTPELGDTSTCADAAAP